MIANPTCKINALWGDLSNKLYPTSLLEWSVSRQLFDCPMHNAVQMKDWSKSRRTTSYIAVVSRSLVGSGSRDNLLLDCKQHVLLCCGCKVQKGRNCTLYYSSAVAWVSDSSTCWWPKTWQSPGILTQSRNPAYNPLCPGHFTLWP